MNPPRRFRLLTCLTASILLALGAGCRTGPAVRGPQTLRVLTYNIHHGEGVDGRLDVERIARLINEHQPDLVALQEVDRGVARTLGRNLPGELSKLTGLHVASAGTSTIRAASTATRFSRAGRSSVPQICISTCCATASSAVC
jgi:hypothetical protein